MITDRSALLLIYTITTMSAGEIPTRPHGTPLCERIRVNTYPVSLTLRALPALSKVAAVRELWRDKK